MADWLWQDWGVDCALAAFAQPFCVQCDMLAITVNYVIAGSANHQTCGRFERRSYLFPDHQVGFVKPIAIA
jgi:hypothetical protein